MTVNPGAINAFHAQQAVEWLQTPEARALLRQEHEDQARLVVAAVGCSQCFARRGEPCRDLASGFHFGRGLNYAKRG